MSGPQTRRQEIRLTDPDIVSELLNRACAAVEDAEYSFLSTRDGLVAAAGAASPGPDELVTLRGSALAAAAVGIGDNFAAIASHGRLQSALFESDHGCLGVFPISTTLLLVVAGPRSVGLARPAIAARKITTMLLAPDN